MLGRLLSRTSMAPFGSPGIRRCLSRAAKTRRPAPLPVGIPASVNKEAAVDLPTLLAFERRGHVCMRGFLDRNEMTAISNVVHAAIDESAAAEHADTLKGQQREKQPFLQTFNPHRTCSKVLGLATSKRLASTAHRLLFDGEPAKGNLRLYQTAIFVKRPGHDETTWHMDLGTAPMETNHMATVWLPLQAVPAPRNGGTALVFARGSHRDVSGAVYETMHADVVVSDRYAIEDHGALEVGDCTWHHGWTLHAANAFKCGEARVAFTATYVSADARALPAHTAESFEDEDRPSYAAWVDDVTPGAVLDHALLPLV